MPQQTIDKWWILELFPNLDLPLPNIDDHKVVLSWRLDGGLVTLVAEHKVRDIDRNVWGVAGRSTYSTGRTKAEIITLLQSKRSSFDTDTTDLITDVTNLTP